MTAAQPLEKGPLEARSSPSACGESEGAGLPQPTAEAAYQLLRRDTVGAESHAEPVAEEVPVAMIYNGLSHVVMMASPTDLEDFALGFSLTEGIIESKSELTDCEISRAGEGVEARIEISARAFFRLKEHRRALQGRTGCGLCGVESLDQALRDLPKLNSELRVRPQAIHHALDALPALQGLHAELPGVGGAPRRMDAGGARVPAEVAVKHGIGGPQRGQFGGGQGTAHGG